MAALTDVDRLRARIDPEVRARLDQLLAVVGPDGLSGIRDIARRRQTQAELKATRLAHPLPDGVDVRDHVVPGAGPGQPAVGVRSYVPVAAASPPRPCIVYLHGGGLVLGSAAEDDGRAADLAVDTACVVVSVDYRLAPEAPFPAAFDDCYRALRWAAADDGNLGIDADRVALYGPSAGGTLAAACALRARDDGGPRLALLVLVSPMLDDRMTELSTFTNTGFGAWSREANQQSWEAYLGSAHRDDLVSAYAVPARAKTVADLPPTYLDVGDLDLFRDEVVTFARRLMQAQVPVELHVYPGGIHGGEHLAPDAELSRRARSYRTAALRRALGEDERRSGAPRA